MSSSVLTLNLLLLSVNIAKCFALTEYTAQTSSHSKCLSRCTSTGSYYYCYVDVNSNWDYCSPHQDSRTVIKKGLTLNFGICKTQCTLSTHHNDYRCISYYFDDEEVECDPNYEYIQQYTSEGEECIGPCGKYDGLSYYWCRNKNRRIKYCSPRELSQEDQTVSDEMKKIPRCFQNTCMNSRIRRQVNPYCSADSRRSGSILAYAATLVALGTVGRLVSVSQPNQAIYRYAYLNPNLPGEPVLPLMISARIDANNIPAQGSRSQSDIPSTVITNINRMGRYRNRPDNNNDENGHLIAYENGGPNAVYNFAPQPRSLNRGITTGVQDVVQSEWRRAEDSINEWVRSGHGFVEQTVVPVYDNHQTNPRPIGFAQHVIYHYPNGTVRYECDDFYSNEPAAAPIIHDELNR